MCVFLRANTHNEAATWELKCVYIAVFRAKMNKKCPLRSQNMCQNHYLGDQNTCAVLSWERNCVLLPFKSKNVCDIAVLGAKTHVKLPYWESNTL